MTIIREVFSFLTENLAEREVLILLGARQVGKTFLMRELESFLLLKKKKVKFFDLELPDHSRLFDRDKSELYSFLTEDCDYLFIDEFQYFENASKLFKAIYDDRRINVKVIASGSSSLDMHRHLKESLAGRKIEKIIRPLSFIEYSQP
ncbi:MAG: AAA family ATPase [bacterium]